MKYFLTICILVFLSSFGNIAFAKDTEIDTLVDAFDNSVVPVSKAADSLSGNFPLPYAVFVDFSANRYKNDKPGISGLILRTVNFGLGLHWSQGVDALGTEMNISEREEFYMRQNVQGFFFDVQGYIHFEKMKSAIYFLLGYGYLSGEQKVNVGYLGDYPEEVDYQTGAVIGVGMQKYITDNYILGVKWDSVHWLSIQIGYAFQIQKKDK